MGLPVPADTPIAAFMLFDAATPPCYPQVKVAKNMQYIVPAVVSCTANEASNKANAHAGRMFFYNLVANNYWNNDYFTEVVQMVLDLIMVNMNKGILRAPEQGIADAVTQVLTLQTSTLFYQFQDLKSMVTPQVLDAAMQNVPFFNNLKQEIMSMYNNNPGYANTGYPGQPLGAHAHAPMGGPGFHGNPGMQHVGTHFQNNNYPVQQNNSWHNGNGFPQRPQSNYPSGQGRFDGPTPNSGAAFASPGSNQFAEMSPTAVENDRFVGRQVRSPQINTVAPQVHRPVANTSKVQTTLIIDKGSEMDRSKHQITYFGDSYVPDSAARGMQFAKATQAMAYTRIVEDCDSIHVDPNVTMEVSLDSAITAGTIKQFKLQNEESAVNVFRCFTIVATPGFCTVNVSDYIKVLREADSFTALVVKMKTLAMALSIKKDNKRYTDSVISFLSRFDSALTSIVNSFLRNNLQLQMKIDSFADDASNLGEYLFKKYGTNYGSAFTSFESEILDTILENIEPELATELMDIYDIPEGLHYGLLPINHSLTFICMNDKELGYKIGDSAVVIEPDTAPSLYQIASSLVAHKKQMDISTLQDILVTADGVRYKLYRNYLKGAEYLIDRA